MFCIVILNKILYFFIKLSMCFLFRLLGCGFQSEHQAALFSFKINKIIFKNQKNVKLKTKTTV